MAKFKWKTAKEERAEQAKRQAEIKAKKERKDRIKNNLPKAKSVSEIRKVLQDIVDYLGLYDSED